MPNHCYTMADITGPIEVLDALWAHAEQDDPILPHYLPLPEGAVTADGAFAEGGYAAACDLWGSKWGDYDLEPVSDDRNEAEPSITIRFSSAWEPVIVGYCRLSALLGITAVLSYEDEGELFVGSTAITDGKNVGGRDLDEITLAALETERGVPSFPSDSQAADYEERWQEWVEAHNDVLSELRSDCVEAAYDCLTMYRQAQSA